MAGIILIHTLHPPWCKKALLTAKLTLQELGEQVLESWRRVPPFSAAILCCGSVNFKQPQSTMHRQTLQLKKLIFFFFPCKHFKASLRREVVIVFLGKGKSHGCRNHQLSTQCLCVWSISVKAGLFGFCMARDGIGFGKVYILIRVSS